MKNLITNYKLYEDVNDPYGEEIDDNKDKPKLHMEEKLYYVVEYNDLDNFVQDVYGDRNYEFVAIQEANNYSLYRFNVTGRIANYDQADAERIRNGHIGMYKNHLLFNVLCADGYIKPGNYLIDVYW